MSAVENNVTQSGQPSLSKQDLSTLDVTKLTALSPEVISRQATINIGTIGHVAHGKSTVVKAVSGVQTVRFKNELERNITIKLEETAARPIEDSEQAPIESSRTCESFYPCDSQNPDPTKSDGNSQNPDPTKSDGNSQNPDPTKSDGNSENHIELEPSNTSQPSQYSTIQNHCKECYVVVTKDDALIEKYIAEFSKKPYTKRAYTKRTYTKRTYTKRSYPKRSTGDERKKRGLEDSSQQIKKKSKTLTEIDEIKKKSTSTEVDDEYTVESILDHVQTENGDLFLVKWRGWSHEYNTWEPYKHLTNCHKALCKFFGSQVNSEESSKGVDELRDKLGKIDDVTLFLKEFRDFWDFFKLPEVDRAETESLLRGIANYSISDPLLMKQVERQVKLCTVWELRNKQMEKLKAWENELNESSTNKGLITVENNFDLEGPPEGFRYINDCVAGENVVIPDEPPIGCNCEPECNKNSESCCGTIWNKVFAYGAFSKLRVGPGMPIYECNKRCGCGPDCRNRVVQKGQVVKLCIFKTNNNCGWGLKTLETIKQGRFIATYVGEMITSEEAERRGQQYDQEGCTYLFDLDFNDVNNSVYTVDAAHMGNVTHFINHSCDPNLQVHAVFINCLDPNIPQLALFACRDIVAGEQLSFDYLCKNDSTTIDPVELKQSTQCQCGSSNCRKYLF